MSVRKRASGKWCVHAAMRFSHAIELNSAEVSVEVHGPIPTFDIFQNSLFDFLKAAIRAERSITDATNYDSSEIDVTV